MVLSEFTEVKVTLKTNCAEEIFVCVAFFSGNNGSFISPDMMIKWLIACLFICPGPCRSGERLRLVICLKDNKHLQLKGHFNALRNSSKHRWSGSKIGEWLDQGRGKFATGRNVIISCALLNQNLWSEVEHTSALDSQMSGILHLKTDHDVCAAPAFACKKE